MITKSTFKEELLKQNIVLTEEMEQQFASYFSLLNEYNKVMDLTAVTGEDEIYDRHFYNSLTIAFNDNFNGLSLCDVGSGAGFPAIPLKIAFPEMKLTIVDSLNKRMEFLKIVVAKLNLKDVTIIPARVEELSVKYYESFDIVTARAVARLNVLTELICQLVKVNGKFIAMKGQKGEEEVLEASNALKTTNFKLINKSSYYLSNNYYFVKTASVNRKYPRQYAKIKSNPL